MVYALIISISQSYDNLYLLKLLLTPDFGLYNNLGLYTFFNHPYAMKASIMHDPDTPRLHEVMSSQHQDEFFTAMGKYIE